MWCPRMVTPVLIHSIRDAGLAVRGRRLALNLTQAQLAHLAGVSRKWVNEFEAGKPSAELELVVRVLTALGLVLVIQPVGSRSENDGATVDLDELLRRYER